MANGEELARALSAPPQQIPRSDIAQTLRRVLGPHLSQGLMNVAQIPRGLLEFVSPGADVRDALASSASATRNLLGGQYAQGGVDMGNTLAALAAMAIPGTVSSVRKGVKAVVPPRTASPDYDVPAGSDPRYRGAAPDRTSFSFLRYKPKKLTPRVADSVAALSDPKNPTRLQLEADIDVGLKVGGADWYNTEELRDWFVEELGEAEGARQWAEFLDLVGAASPGSKVPANIRNASAIRQRLQDPAYVADLLQADTQQKAIALGRQRMPGYGHKTQGLQEMNVAGQQQGKWLAATEPGVPPGQGSWIKNPKPKGFAWSLKGSEKNMAADLHFTRYLAMASRNPDWLSTTADISDTAAKQILAAGGKKLKPYFGSRTVGDKTQITFNPKKAAADGKLTADQAADLNIPALWADKPNDAEYAAFEDLMYEIGKQRGLTAPQTQAAIWMGAAERTGVDATSQGTFMQVLRDVADRRAKEEGLTRAEVMRRFIKEKGLLALPATVLGAQMVQEE